MARDLTFEYENMLVCEVKHMIGTTFEICLGTSFVYLKSRRILNGSSVRIKYKLTAMVTETLDLLKI